MPRTILADIRWELLFQVMISTGRIYDKTEDRMAFEGILYRMRTGIPWRDLPSEYSTGAATESSEQIGKSRGGNSPKIHLAVDSGGLPICFDLSEGQRHDVVHWCLYKYRNLVENAFARIKQYRAISTRYDRLERNYASMVSLAFMLMWLPMYC